MGSFRFCALYAIVLLGRHCIDLFGRCGIHTSGSYFHSSPLEKPTTSSSPSSIRRTKEPTLRQLQIRHSNRIKCIRKHGRTPPIWHGVAWITDCEEDDDTRNGCSCIYCCGEDILDSWLVAEDVKGREIKVTNIVLCPPSKEVVLDVAVENPVYECPGSVVDTYAQD